jgi:hypothetical protein
MAGEKSLKASSSRNGGGISDLMRECSSLTGMSCQGFLGYSFKMLDLQNRIERLFAGWTWLMAAAAASLALLILLAAELLVRALPIGQAVSIAPGQIVSYLSRWNSRDNPDSFKRVDVRQSKDDTFAIAWIGASALTVRNAPADCALNGEKSYSLPQALARKLITVRSKPVRVEEYFQSGISVFDLRRAALNAIESEDTDAILMELNPVVFLNDHRLFGYTRQRADILFQDHARAFDFKLIWPVLRPTEVVLASLARISDLVRIRGDIASIGPKTALGFPHPRIAGTTPPRSPKGIMKLVVPSMKLNKLQRAAGNLFTLQNFGETSPAAEIMRQTFVDLSASGKTVLVYMSPVRSEFRSNPEVVRQMDKIGVRASELLAPFLGPHFIARTDTGLAEIGRLDFRDRDFIHLSCGIGLIDTVVDMLSKSVGGDGVVSNPPEQVFGS